MIFFNVVSLKKSYFKFEGKNRCLRTLLSFDQCHRICYRQPQGKDELWGLYHTRNVFPHNIKDIKCFLKFVQHQTTEICYMPWPAKKLLPKTLIPMIPCKFDCQSSPKNEQPAQPIGQTCQKRTKLDKTNSIAVKCYFRCLCHENIAFYLN